ncbi:MAG: response regulator [Archangium sp.]|nr:response regulator [Archangium sp.]
MTVLSEWLRTRAAARADAANQARSLFLANMSHELRTPMNGVIGLADLLLHSEPRADQKEHLELVRRSGEHMVTLINDLIDLTRLESGRLVVEAVPVELRPLVHDTVALVRPTAWNKGLDLEVEIAATVPEWVVTDGVRLRQVLMNLVGNAVKFTERGQVRVVVEAADDRLRLQVNDSGVGMSPEVLNRVFRPFEQADASFTRRYGGSGLGLAISKQLVRAMNGSIHVESELKKGSRFTVDLPAPATEAPPALPKPAPSPPANFRARSQQHILVVEDNAVNLRVAVGLLQKAGFTTDTARNGHEAVQAVQVRLYDAILMDCHMPEMDGFEATRLIRALGGKASQTPILALTASALKEDLDRCTSVGMNACVTKPVSLQSLTHAIDQLTRATLS